MSKMIAIIDEPDCCFGCPFLQDMTTISRWRCVKSKVVISEIDLTKRPEFCPLRELPGKREVFNNYDDYLNGIDDGWNACIDEILGE